MQKTCNMRFIGSLNITFGSILRILGVVLLVTLISIYVHFQARNLLQGPGVSLTGTYTTVQHDRIVTLNGSTSNIVKLTLDGREIHTNEQGVFTQTLVLENGYTIMELSAQDRFGRTTTLRKAFVYVPTPT